jgi:predicted LPLAT superfamily acyltransferase
MKSPLNNKNEEPRRPWTSRSIGSSFQHHFFYFMIRVGGRRLAYFFLYFIVAYYILFRSAIRRRCSFYLAHRFPESSVTRRIIDNYKLSLSFGKVLIDRAIIGILGSEKISVTFEQKETLKKLVSDGKGVIFLMAHVGCWQVALSALNYLKIPVNMVLRREEGDIDRHYFEHHASSGIPFGIIDPDGFLGGTLEMINCLKRGEVMCIMGDRVFGNLKNTLSFDFLGEKASFPFSAFKVASATGAPVVVLLTYKKKADTFGLELANIMHISENLGRTGENYRPYVNEFVKILERYTEVHPFQFFNFYDMWG